MRDIEIIERDHRSVMDRKLALFDKWLRVYPAASWNDVVLALDKVEEFTLALSVREYNGMAADVPSHQNYSMQYLHDPAYAGSNPHCTMNISNWSAEVSPMKDHVLVKFKRCPITGLPRTENVTQMKKENKTAPDSRVQVLQKFPCNSVLSHSILKYPPYCHGSYATQPMPLRDKEPLEIHSENFSRCSATHHIYVTKDHFTHNNLAHNLTGRCEKNSSHYSPANAENQSDDIGDDFDGMDSLPPSIYHYLYYSGRSRSLPCSHYAHVTQSENRYFPHTETSLSMPTNYNTYSNHSNADNASRSSSELWEWHSDQLFSQDLFLSESGSTADHEVPSVKLELQTGCTQTSSREGENLFSFLMSEDLSSNPFCSTSAPTLNFSNPARVEPIPLKEEVLKKHNEAWSKMYKPGLFYMNNIMVNGHQVKNSQHSSWIDTNSNFDDTDSLPPSIQQHFHLAQKMSSPSTNSNSFLSGKDYDLQSCKSFSPVHSHQSRSEENESAPMFKHEEVYPNHFFGHHNLPTSASSSKIETRPEERFESEDRLHISMTEGQEAEELSSLLISEDLSNDNLLFSSSTYPLHYTYSSSEHSTLPLREDVLKKHNESCPWSLSSYSKWGLRKIRIMYLYLQMQ